MTHDRRISLLHRFSARTTGLLVLSTFVVLTSAGLRPALRGQARAQLWRIGTPDASGNEFALAPDGYRKFQDDGFFVVGRSDSKRDWPYIHPGPADSWAGSRQHVFTIIFALQKAAPAGNCALVVDLAERHSSSPPAVEITINGRESRGELQHSPKERSSSFRMIYEIPAAFLQAGLNEVRIRTLSGSWMKYDAVGFEAPAEAEIADAGPTIFADATARSVLQENEGRLEQPVRGVVRHYGAPVPFRIFAERKTLAQGTLKEGVNDFEGLMPAVDHETSVTLALEAGNRPAGTRKLTLKPVRCTTVYILAHSHTDIGYTELQTEIEDKQVQNLLKGIAYARQTASNPPGARFVWNIEVLWAADLYLRRLDTAQRQEFMLALKQGQIALNGMYLNELTGLCRPEELVRLFHYASKLSGEAGVAIDSAMISDVPGYTWGLVPAMAQAGIRYFSTAPNYFDRIGDILVKWENKPFWWIGPDRRSRVLVWIPYKGYAMSHSMPRLTAEFVQSYQDRLDQTAYPYDIAYMRWSGHGDNAAPDPAICDFVKEWNGKYAFPRFAISSTGEAFRAFEKKYGAQIPSVAGDWTPYWEDGAGSSALETAMNRASSDRITQAEALWAMLNPAAYPATAFEEGWRNVLLYSEHTWGAWCSVTAPFRRETREQWAIKQGYAFAADIQSRDLLSRALSLPAGGVEPDAVDIFNTSSWPRSGPVTLPKFLAEAGDRVTDDSGRAVASQRLRSGELLVWAQDIPPLAGRRFHIGAGLPQVGGRVGTQGSILDNGIVKIRVDEKTGGIVELRLAGLDVNLADTADGQALNEYLYFTGDNPVDVRRNGPVRIKPGEAGPLTASLVIQSDAPGCSVLLREVRLTAGQDCVEIVNTLDKQRIAAADYRSREGKESLNFGFPFAVHEGQVRLEVPFGVVRPDEDQIPSACKNWFSVNRWVDIANEDYGVTWVTPDAPLVQVGGLTANLLNSQSNPDVWRKKVGPTQKLYSWTMNNHWGTNYRAYQEGPQVFRFVIRPHRAYDPAAASRLAIEWCQPLLPVAARGRSVLTEPLVRVSSPEVLVTGLKPSDDGKAVIVRLWGGAGRESKVSLVWREPAPKSMWMSDTGEKPLTRLTGPFVVPACGLVTVRADVR